MSMYNEVPLIRPPLRLTNDGLNMEAQIHLNKLLVNRKQVVFIANRSCYRLVLIEELYGRAYKYEPRAAVSILVTVTF